MDRTAQQEQQTSSSQPTSGATPAPAPRGGGIQLKGLSYDDQVAALSPNVQMKGDGEGNVHAAAARGTAGSGGTLPHLDAIQQSFGRHDVSNVQAYQGGAAAEACGAMGAEAYATGNKVAFGGGGASLHTAAHEAAHIVQQRAGVSLKGGVGESGDAYEQHADQVADLVVQGKSAEGLLDKMAGGGASGATAGGSVQREQGPKERADWTKAYTNLLSSNLWMFNQQKAYARTWESVAEEVDPPPAWKTALKIAGSAVLAGALGGIGGAIAAKAITETMKAVTQRVIEGAIEAGKKAAEELVGVVSGGGSDSKALVKSFCNQQAEAMAKSGAEADARYDKEAGDAFDPKMSTAELKKQTSLNRLAGADKATLHREMTVGLMNFASVAGADGNGMAKKGLDVEDTSLKGILGLVISGEEDSPTRILRAETEGVNEKVKKSLRGSLGSWLNGGARKKGLQITVKTENQFKVSADTRAKLDDADQYNRGTVASRNSSVYFAFGRTANGTMSYIDTDMSWASDQGWGANAGRWFLRNVKSTHQIVDELRSLGLPRVS